MATRLFDRTDLADWELGYESAVAALEIPALKSCMPEYMCIGFTTPTPEVIKELEAIAFDIQVTNVVLNYKREQRRKAA